MEDQNREEKEIDKHVSARQTLRMSMRSISPEMRILLFWISDVLRQSKENTG